jgi:hypothetical protein
MPQQRFKSTTYRFQPYNSFDRNNLPDTRTSTTSSQSNLQNNNSDSHSSENFQNSLDLTTITNFNYVNITINIHILYCINYL